MSLMGHYAAANHALIHKHIAENLGVEVLLDVENHHNFAWKEVPFGKDVIVHCKGATPALDGVLGIISGSKATKSYLVNPLASFGPAPGQNMPRRRTSGGLKFCFFETDGSTRKHNCSSFVSWQKQQYFVSGWIPTRWL